MSWFAVGCIAYFAVLALVPTWGRPGKQGRGGTTEVTRRSHD